MSSVPAHAAVVLAVGLAPRGSVRKGHSSRALESSAGEPLARRVAQLALETAPSQLLVCVPADDHTAVEVALRGLRLRCLPVPGGGLGPALVAALRALPRDCAAALALLCDPSSIGTGAHLARLLAAWRAAPELPAVSLDASGAGLPALLPHACWDDLIAQRDSGPRAVLRDPARRISTVAWMPPAPAPDDEGLTA